MWRRPLGRALVRCLFWWTVVVPLATTGGAYSVLSHEALIDAVWGPVIVPLLLGRFPDATPAELAAAHAYAYGGCEIQDLGYYPFGNHYFSNLTHYARTGDFVQALIRESRTVDEYAFAIGALSHYVADVDGHPLAVNIAVPAMYPRLRRKFGNRVTYEDDPTAHIMTEFSFDVVQITGAGYLPRTYHNFIGFQVPKSLLERAFQDTYGMPMKRLFWWEGLSLRLYRASASEIIPKLGEDMWKHRKAKLKRLDPSVVTPRFNHKLAPENYQTPSTRRSHPLRVWSWRWRQTAKRANVDVASRVAVTLIEILPKVGSLRTLKFKPPTVQVQDFFIHSFDKTVADYQSELSQLGRGHLNLAEDNLDLGRRRLAGEYELADETYARWLRDLAKRHFQHLSIQVADDMLDFYADLQAPIATKTKPRRWQKIISDLNRLRATPANMSTSGAHPAR